MKRKKKFRDYFTACLQWVSFLLLAAGLGVLLEWFQRV